MFFTFPCHLRFINILFVAVIICVHGNHSMYITRKNVVAFSPELILNVCRWLLIMKVLICLVLMDQLDYPLLDFRGSLIKHSSPVTIGVMFLDLAPCENNTSTFFTLVHFIVNCVKYDGLLSLFKF